jgi:hypothetical protein
VRTCTDLLETLNGLSPRERSTCFNVEPLRGRRRDAPRSPVAVLQFAARHPVGRAPVLTLRRFLYDGVDSKQLNQHFPPGRIGPDARRPS